MIFLQIYCYYKCSVALPHSVIGWSAVCDGGISWSYSLFVSILVCNNLVGEERAGCFALFVFLLARDCCVALPHNATGLSAVCDCGISCSYSLTILDRLSTPPPPPPPITRNIRHTPKKRNLATPKNILISYAVPWPKDKKQIYIYI